MNENKKQFWDDIILNKDGSINFEQVYKELFDYSDMINTNSSIAYEISLGILSKPNYTEQVLKQQLNEKWIEKTIARDDMLEYIKAFKGKELKEEINLYFNN